MRPTAVHLAQLQELETAINQDQPVAAIQRAAATLNDIVNPSHGGRIRPAAGARIQVVGASTSDEIDGILDRLETHCQENAGESRLRTKSKASTAKAKETEEVKGKASAKDAEVEAKKAEKEQVSARAAGATPTAMSVGAAQQKINEQMVQGSVEDFTWQDAIPLIQLIVDLVRRWRGQ